MGLGIGVGLSDRRRKNAPPWTPASLANKILWLRADLGAAVVGGHIPVWLDQSGAGHDFTAPVPSGNQPVPVTWTAGNSTPGLYFDGNDNFLSSGLIMPLTGSYTLILVCAFADTTARCAFSSSLGGASRLSQSVNGDSKLEDWKSGVSFSTDGSAVTTPLNIVVQQTIATPPTGTVFHRNGVLTATSSPDATILTPTGAAAIGYTGGSLPFLGTIAEIIVTSARLTAPELAAWNAYSLARYGV